MFKACFSSTGELRLYEVIPTYNIDCFSFPQKCYRYEIKFAPPLIYSKQDVSFKNIACQRMEFANIFLFSKKNSE